MLAIFCFFARATEEPLGNITVHQHSSEYDQLLRAGYSFRLFATDTARNHVDTPLDFQLLYARYQPEIEYHQGLPVKRDQQGRPTFGGLVVGTPRPWTDEFTDEDHEPGAGW